MSVVGVDVGGTFTDIFILDEATGRARVAKVPTTRPDQSGGFLNGMSQAGDNLSAVTTVVHGTTAGTNALLERKGAKIGLITTQGFRDALEMRRRDRRTTWGLRGDFKPVVPRDRRLEVEERTLADGTVHTGVNVAAVTDAARYLINMGCEAVAVAFINAYANPTNEQIAAKALREIWPNTHVSVSHEILPEIREFERTSTTALNAYLQPEVAGYLARLEDGMKAGGFDGEFLLVQSNGGVMAVETACQLPVRTALSGPAAGVIAAAYVATTAGYENVITGDVGGTSFDVSLIADGQSALAAQTSIDFGMVVRTPMIEITTIGAGGGSIAWVDKGGLLNIGPESAGSNPGPVAYGRGNDRPTVTDANIVLGRIDASRPIGGSLEKLNVDAARMAIDAHVGTPLGLDAEEAAEAILRVANARMAGAIRLVSIERGHDPKRFSYMPFGGGGALHACALVEECDLARAIVPRYPGVTSALGCVIADMRHDFVQTINTLVDAVLPPDLETLVTAHRDKGAALLDASKVAFDTVDLLVEADMAYAGQTHTVPVQLMHSTGIGGDFQGEFTHAHLTERFDATYRAAYGRLLDGGARRILNLRTSIIGKRPKFDLTSLAPDQHASIEAAQHGSRQVHMAGAWHETALYARLKLPVGARIEGPAILDQPDTTILIEPGYAGSVDAYGNLILERTL